MSVTCQSVAMDAAIMQAGKSLGWEVLEPCTNPGEVEVPTKGVGTYTLCHACVSALETYMSVARKVVDELNHHRRDSP